ncbi:c-type cytochrome [Caulobacter mirabilis]|uniref:Cytochrome c5 family protein n=1 Tax=Caulobacter mirabilis TaxID=69666 RepID=A0A2D2AWJ9_9CAUL|nr:c-type cytochrome [Caulobacter mirabilis]ATQ42388.1 cytochrome c5 family protein [Caulobacter mirabilis]
MRRGMLIVGAGLLLLAACGPKTPPPPTQEEALKIMPADARLAGLYETSCKACHAIADTGAPGVHDRAAWDKRWTQGEQVLLDRTIQGYNAMPAGGQCASCTPDDLKALIHFMAGREDSAK